MFTLCLCLIIVLKNNFLYHVPVPVPCWIVSICSICATKIVPPGFMYSLPPTKSIFEKVQLCNNSAHLCSFHMAACNGNATGLKEMKAYSTLNGDSWYLTRCHLGLNQHVIRTSMLLHQVVQFRYNGVLVRHRFEHIFQNLDAGWLDQLLLLRRTGNPGEERWVGPCARWFLQHFQVRLK